MLRAPSLAWRSCSFILVLPPVSTFQPVAMATPAGIWEAPRRASEWCRPHTPGAACQNSRGMVAASSHYDLAAPPEQQGASKITVPLKEKESEQNSLALYTFVDNDQWQRLSGVTLVGGRRCGARRRRHSPRKRRCPAAEQGGDAGRWISTWGHERSTLSEPSRFC